MILATNHTQHQGLVAISVQIQDPFPSHYQYSEDPHPSFGTMPTAPRPKGDYFRALFEQGIQIGADHGIIRDNDLIYVLPQKEVRQVDYFHGHHGDAAMCQDCSRNKDYWFDYEIIHAGGQDPGHLEHARPTVHMIRCLQRRFRRFRRLAAAKRRRTSATAAATS